MGRGSGAGSHGHGGKSPDDSTICPRNLTTHQTENFTIKVEVADMAEGMVAEDIEVEEEEEEDTVSFSRIKSREWSTFVATYNLIADFDHSQMSSLGSGRRWRTW